jgi:exosortase/archaeosortase family protein
MYIGLTHPGGFLSSTFLEQFNAFSLLEILLLKVSKNILITFGYPVIEYSYNVLGIKDGNSVRILHGCLGLYIMIAYLSLILGISGKHKLTWIIIGLTSIQILNIGRVILILLYNHKVPGILYKVHDWVNLLGYSLIFLLFYIWFRKYAIEP